MFKITKETKHGIGTYKCNIATERSAKMVLDDLKNTHNKLGHIVYYHGDAISVSSEEETFLVKYTILKQ